MRGCTVSAPVLSCNVHLIKSSSSKFAAVELLTKECLYFIVEPNKSRAKDLYAQTCAYLRSQGMQDADLFGLAFVSDGEYLFVDPDNKLSKYAPKHWKSSSSFGLDSSNRPTLILYFRVQYYVDNSLLLRNNLTRHHYYLQLRANVLARGLVHPCSSRDVLYVLAGYALQADYGDHDADQHAGPYFTPHEYLPSEMVDSDVGLEQTIPALHRDNRGLSRAKAELRYIAQASSMEPSQLTHNAHLYRLKHKKQELGNGTVFLAICAKGIEIYEENSAKLHTATFLWNNIGKLCFDRKKFEIQALNWLTSGQKYTYYTNNDEKSKHLLFLCRVTHQFSMTIHSRLLKEKRLQDEERQRYRNCYMYSNKLGVDQRTSSYMSTASSDTTSGIASDRPDDLEIVTETAPIETTDPSTESPPSQCSSSNSTVVPAESTNSSLELGYSHTAQNSALSDCSVQSSGVFTSTALMSSETSGIATASSENGLAIDSTEIDGVLSEVNDLETDLSETSGVATESSFDILQSKATSSGFIVPEVEEDGRQSPEGSVHSFHGDGSDPTDCGPRDLLSAEELSDLIVGEIASGVYPGRATVSSTLDSDSDYVTLPPPESETNYVTLAGIPAPCEANARLVTTKPHINIITAHTSHIATTAPKSFPKPIFPVDKNYQPLYPMEKVLPQPVYPIEKVVPQPIYPIERVAPQPIFPIEKVTPKSIYPLEKMPPTTSYLAYDPGAKMKHAPIQVGINNYLDVHASKNGSPYLRGWQYSPPVPPPTLLHPRQPPPPPPPTQNLATVYTSQVTRGQIEQFRQQMHSDVDYVIYPLKDPAVSKQEYIDVKQGMLLARAVHYPSVVPPPPYPRISAENVLYRSTPNVAGGYLTNIPLESNYRSRYVPAGSHYSASTSPLYSAATSYSSSSTQSLRYSPMPAGGFVRAKSDDNLLNSFDKYKRFPPPPPPPPYEVQIPEPPASVKSDSAASGMLDIRTLREKSKNLDLPLISALCNDRSLLKQTNAFVMPRHPSDRPQSWHVESSVSSSTGDVAAETNSQKHGKVKYPVSGLSTTQMCKPLRRVAASTHTHPNQSKNLLTLVGRSNSNGSAIKTRDALVP